MQNSGAIQNADPSLQAAYVARLQQQASQIKNLLKLLNSSGVNKSSNDANDSNGYESLWEVGLARNIRDDLIPEVEEGGANEEADESQDVNHEDIYENTGVFPHNFSLSVGEFLWVSRRELFRGCRVIPSCTMLCDTMQIFWKTVVSCNIALSVDSYVWAVWSNCDQKFTGYKGSQFDSVERLSDEIWPRLAPAPALQVVATCLHLNFPTSSSSGLLGFLPESVQSAARLWPGPALYTCRLQPPSWRQEINNISHRTGSELYYGDHLMIIGVIIILGIIIYWLTKTLLQNFRLWWQFAGSVRVWGVSEQSPAGWAELWLPVMTLWWILQNIPRHYRPDCQLPDPARSSWQNLPDQVRISRLTRRWPAPPPAPPTPSWQLRLSTPPPPPGRSARKTRGRFRNFGPRGETGMSRMCLVTFNINITGLR